MSRKIRKQAWGTPPRQLVLLAQLARRGGYASVSLLSFWSLSPSLLPLLSLTTGKVSDPNPSCVTRSLTDFHRINACRYRGHTYTRIRRSKLLSNHLFLPWSRSSPGDSRAFFFPDISHLASSCYSVDLGFVCSKICTFPRVFPCGASKQNPKTIGFTQGRVHQENGGKLCRLVPKWT